MCCPALASRCVSADVATTKSSHTLYPSSTRCWQPPGATLAADTLPWPLSFACQWDTDVQGHLLWGTQQPSGWCERATGLNINEQPVCNIVHLLNVFLKVSVQILCLYTCRVIALLVAQWRQFKRYCCISLQKPHCCCLWFHSFLIYYDCLIHLVCINQAFHETIAFQYLLKQLEFALQLCIHAFLNPAKTTVAFMGSDFYMLLSVNMWSGRCCCGHSSIRSRQSLQGPLTICVHESSTSLINTHCSAALCDARNHEQIFHD